MSERYVGLVVPVGYRYNQAEGVDPRVMPTTVALLHRTNTLAPALEFDGLPTEDELTGYYRRSVSRLEQLLAITDNPSRRAAAAKATLMEGEDADARMNQLIESYGTAPDDSAKIKYMNLYVFPAGSEPSSAQLMDHIMSRSRTDLPTKAVATYMFDWEKAMKTNASTDE